MAVAAAVFASPGATKRYVSGLNRLAVLGCCHLAYSDDEPKREKDCLSNTRGQQARHKNARNYVPSMSEELPIRTSES